MIGVHIISVAEYFDQGCYTRMKTLVIFCWCTWKHRIIPKRKKKEMFQTNHPQFAKQNKHKPREVTHRQKSLASKSCARKVWYTCVDRRRSSAMQGFVLLCLKFIFFNNMLFKLHHISLAGMLSCLFRTCKVKSRSHEILVHMDIHYTMASEKCL